MYLNLSVYYKKWELPYVVKPLPELSLPRSILHRLLAIRTGHGDFSWYHTKFNHEDAKLDCSCGQPKTPSPTGSTAPRVFTLHPLTVALQHVVGGVYNTDDT